MDKHSAPAAETKALANTSTQAQIEALLAKAQQGDMKAWRTLKADLDKVHNWETQYPSPAEHARRYLLDAVIGSNHFVKEAWDRRAHTMITELAGTNPTPLERILCERVATCWLDMALAELNYASRVKDGLSFAAGEYYQKARDRAHKRYLSACLALAKVRRLLAPTAQQINIAQPGAQQLNIAAPAPAASVPSITPYHGDA
jgi:hypothetical protein